MPIPISMERPRFFDVGTIHFANMMGADFRGSDMRNFDYGYTSLQGTVDAFTQNPEGCEPVDQWIDCIR